LDLSALRSMRATVGRIICERLYCPFAS